MRGGDKPFSVEGGLKLLTGNLGRSVIKTSAVAPDRRVITAPAVVIEHQDELDALFAAGELNNDCVVVVRGQGPKANGMPELHKLTPFLGALQDQGYRVALVTDGRMSGASGKVPAAIHLTPEALDGGLIGRIQTGDMICLDSDAGELTLQVDALNRTLDATPGARPPSSAVAAALEGVLKAAQGRAMRLRRVQADVAAASMDDEAAADDDSIAGDDDA